MDKIFEKIDVLCEEANALYENEDYTKALLKYKEALYLLPMPRNQWEASAWLYTSIGDTFFGLKKFNDAKENYYNALNCPNGHGNAYIYLSLGQALFELQESSTSKDFLRKALALEGRQIFLGENRKYIESIELFSKGDLLQLIDTKLNNQKETPTQETIVNIDNKIDTYTKEHGIDEELIIQQALLLLTIPLVDYVKSLQILAQIKSVQAYILSASIQLNHQGYIEEDLITALKGCKQASPSEKSMIYYLLSQAKGSQDSDYEPFLLAAIDEDTTSVLPYIALSEYYMSIYNGKLRIEDLKVLSNYGIDIIGDMKKKAFSLNKIGISNIQKILSEDDNFNYASYEWYINEYIKGIYVSRFNYKNYKMMEL